MTPNFFILGVQKGGTSSLALWLRQHPHVFLSSRKELHFYCSCPDPELRAVRSHEEYLTHFASAPASATIVGEASPCYLYYQDAIASINAAYPDARFLVSLRDPVERYFSHYLMNEIYRPTGKSPEALLESNLAGDLPSNALDDLVGAGMYSVQLRSAWRQVGRERILVTFLENLAAEPKPELLAIEAHLGLRHHHFDTSIRDKEYVEPKNAVGRMALRNPVVRQIGVKLLPANIRRYLRTEWLGSAQLKPQLPDPLRHQLESIYREDSIRLEQMLGIALPWNWHNE